MSTEASLEGYIEEMRQRSTGKEPFGGVAKLNISDLGIILIDGSGQKITISAEDQEANVTLTMNHDTWKKITQGELDGVSAFMQGLMTVEGDQSIAMVLGDLLGGA